MRQLALGLLLLAAVPTHATTVEEIPNPRPAGWAVDLTGRIPPETLRQIDGLGDEVKARNGAEVVVVVVGSTGGAESHEFATRLFNTWGVGDRTRNNGVLVFAALDDRASEIILGSGIDSEPSRRTSEDIMQNEMVPRFRAGDPAGAVLAGTTACAQRILDVPVSPAVPAEAVPSGMPPAPQPLAQPEPVRPATPWTQPSPAPDGVSAGSVLMILFGLAALGGGLFIFNRYRPRPCPECRQRMMRLSEADDDQHLEPSERAEERVGSVDYDVWWCRACDRYAKRRFASFFTRYSQCPKCRAKTVLKTKDTLRSADYDQEGLVQVLESCAFCSFETVSTFTTPRLVRSTTYDSSSWSAASSSVSAPDVSSSASSDFGGGHSDGGGASGHW